ncbi:MAG TPA: hypothetical protein VLC98_16690 [Phnomibacter sp.]|nr:hypothetical protein [Phnomibacter sp.]
MKILEVTYLQNFIEENPLPSVKSESPVLHKPLNQKKSEIYQELLDFLYLDDYGKNAVNDLKHILVANKCLEQADVREWTLKHLEIFEINLIDFGIKYLDSGNDKDGNLHLPSLNEYVCRTSFLSIIKFWKCMWLLYFGEYHLDKENRTPPDPIESYYSSVPDSVAPNANEIILRYLEID